MRLVVDRWPLPKAALPGKASSILADEFFSLGEPESHRIRKTGGNWPVCHQFPVGLADTLAQTDIQAGTSLEKCL
jgi:hypothetical protein